jgi:cell division protein ZapA
MAQLKIPIGGHNYELACRDGEEEHLRAIARTVDRKCAEATQAMGGLNETRQLLFAALLLADELNDVRAAATASRLDAPPAPALGAMLAPAIERMAERIEFLARRLEGEAENA